MSSNTDAGLIELSGNASNSAVIDHDEESIIIESNNTSDVEVSIYDIEGDISSTTISGDDIIVFNEYDVDNIITSGKCGDNLTYTVTGMGNNLTLTISGEGDMYDYAYFNPNNPTAYSTGNLPPWVSNAEIRKNIKRIVVKEGVTGIGSGAFSYVGSPEYGTKARINRIRLPLSLRRIGWYAFYYTGCNEITIGSPNSPVKMECHNPKTGQLLTGHGLACSNFRKVNICLDDTSGRDFSYSTVESVTFLEGTETIPAVCFESCEELQNVKIAKSVTAIAGQAFDDCHNLVKVDILSDSNLESIGFEAFMNCYNLDTITLPENLGIIDKDAFENCTSLESIDIPDSVNTINQSAFKGCTSLRTVGLSAGINKISYGLFSGCENLESITIPDSVTEIASAAFLNCKSLTTMEIPANVNAIVFGYTVMMNMQSSFGGADRLVEITVDPKNTTFKSYDGCLYNAESTELLYCPEGKDKLVIAPSTTTISRPALACEDNNSKLKELYFGTCSPEISDNAFSGINATAYYNTFLNTWPSGKLQNYGGQITWVEKALDLSDCSMAVSPTSYTYDGTEKKPTVSLVYGGKKLTKNTDFTFTYKNNVKGGVAKVVATGVGYFTGTATKTFIINVATPVLSSVAAGNDGIVFKWKAVSGANKYSVFRKTGNDGWKKLGVTTSTSYTDKTAIAGYRFTYTVRCVADDEITYVSNYNTTGKAIKYAAKPTLSAVQNQATGVIITWKKAAGAAKYRVFKKSGSGGWMKLVDTTSVSYLDKAVKSGTKYTYTVRCISSDGKVYTSGYNTTGKVTVFAARPTISSVSSPKAKQLTVKWKKVTGITGYQIQYSTSSSFAKGNKAVTVKSTTAVSKTIGSLTSKKKYYVRMRTYKTVSGKNYYSTWSTVKSVTVK